MHDVTNLDDHRPYFVLATDDGNAHVIPVELVKNWVKGEVEFDEDDVPVLRKIIKERMWDVYGLEVSVFLEPGYDNGETS